MAQKGGKDKPKVTIANPKHSSHVFTMFSELREEEELCDIRLEVSDEAIPVHKVVLAACSPYFRDAFQKLGDNEDRFVVEEEHNAKVVEAIVDYFYNGRLVIEAKLLSDLMETATVFQVTDITEQCQEKVIQYLTVDNCLKFYEQAALHNQTDMLSKISRYINCHFSELIHDDYFLEISPATLVAALKSNTLNIENEQDVYEALKKWCQHDATKRNPYREELFSHIRFFELASDFLEETVIPDLLKGEEKICKKKILDAIDFKNATQEQQRILKPKMNPRYPSKVVYMFGNKSTLVERYDPVDLECVEDKSLMDSKEVGVQRILKHAIIVNGDLYVVTPHKVSVYDSVELKWTNVGKGVPIHESCFCADNKCFYVVGGSGNGSEEKNPGRAVRCFNVDTLTWSRLPDLAENIRSAACVTHNKRIYVMGGYLMGKANELDKASNKSYRFSSRNAKWRGLKPMISERYQFSAVVVDDVIYAIGGRTSCGVTNSIEMLDLNAQEEMWLEFTPMIKPRNDYGLASFSGEIWCFGGRAENTIEKYDFKKESWELVGKLREIRYGMSCVAYRVF